MNDIETALADVAAYLEATGTPADRVEMVAGFVPPAGCDTPRKALTALLDDLKGRDVHPVTRAKVRYLMDARYPEPKPAPSAPPPATPETA